MTTVLWLLLCMKTLQGLPDARKSQAHDASMYKYCHLAAASEKTESHWFTNEIFGHLQRTGG